MNVGVDLLLCFFWGDCSIEKTGKLSLFDIET